MLCWSFTVWNDGDHRFLYCSPSKITIPVCCPFSPDTVYLSTTAQLRQPVEFLCILWSTFPVAVGREKLPEHFTFISHTRSPWTK